MSTSTAGAPAGPKDRLARPGEQGNSDPEKAESSNRGDGCLFEREDWTAFRTLDGLCRKAGTAREGLAGVVIKEVVDNALDAAGDCDLHRTGSTVIVRDRGPGIAGDDEEIARLFSMNRPLTSSKYLRLPTRGALGNGLRVAVGAVAATGGRLEVATAGRVLQIDPDPPTGRSTAIRLRDWAGEGTEIRIRLGSPMELTEDDLGLAQIAIGAARSQQKRYAGKTSPHWYDVDAFHELLLSVRSDRVTVREFLSHFDGCSIAKDVAAGFSGRSVRGLTREEAGRLLEQARSAAREVRPPRMGCLGESAFGGAYVKEERWAIMPADRDGMEIRLPVVTEAWAEPHREGSTVVFLVNGTPCVAESGAVYRSKDKATVIYGPGLRLTVPTGKAGVIIFVNIMVPYMPTTSDGKEPDLGRFGAHFRSVIERVAKRAKRMQGAVAKPDIKGVVLENMKEQIDVVSDGRRYRFNWRQVFYRMRPIVKEEIGEDLNWGYFSQTLVAAYEEEFGEEPMAYRDPRGTFYTPHAADSLPLGTLQVEEYCRPAWQFNKVLYLEKEGFFEALKADGWPERHDCALMTSKGQPSRAARDLIDLIGESGEPVQVFCLHDCDAAGTMIFQSLQEETRARPRRNVEIINLGLNPDEARALADSGLVEIEHVSYEKAQAVAAFVEHRSACWLQSHRVELNAFTTPQFIEWLDRKMAGHDGKVVPPDSVLIDRLNDRVRGCLRESIVARILEEAGVDGLVDEAIGSMSTRLGEVAADLPGRVHGDLQGDPQRHWADAVADLAEGLAQEHAARIEVMQQADRQGRRSRP